MNTSALFEPSSYAVAIVLELSLMNGILMQSQDGFGSVWLLCVYLRIK